LAKTVLIEHGLLVLTPSVRLLSTAVTCCFLPHFQDSFSHGRQINLLCVILIGCQPIQVTGGTSRFQSLTLQIC